MENIFPVAFFQKICYLYIKNCKGCDYLNTIYLTQEFCELLKQFRIRNGKTTKDIYSIINRTPSYLSKLESGMTKKIESSIFMSICDTIAEKNDGIVDFIIFAFRDNPNFDADTMLTLANIDDVMYKFFPPKKLITYISDKLNTASISIADLVSELNRNRDLSDIPTNILSNLAENLYSYVDAAKEHIVIKLHYTYEEIEKIVSGADTTNYVTLNAILYTLYKLLGIPNENAQIKAIKTLNDRFHVISNRKKQTIVITSKADEEKYLGVLEPKVEENYKSVIEGLRLALLISQSKGGAQRIETMRQNLKDDMGFTFAFISTDLTKITSLPKKYKKEFIQELNALIDKYSAKTDEDMDFYFDN